MKSINMEQHIRNVKLVRCVADMNHVKYSRITYPTSDPIMAIAQYNEE